MARSNGRAGGREGGRADIRATSASRAGADIRATAASRAQADLRATAASRAQGDIRGTSRTALPGYRRLAGAAGLAALVLALGGCTALDSALAEVPFLSFMQKSPAPPPYGMPRNAPPGSIPYESPAGEVFPGLQPTDQSITAFAATHRNPIPMTDSAALRAGQALFNRYCFVCHGPQARGDGPILNNPLSKDPTQQSGKFPFAPNLTLPITVARADGYIFGIITAGRGLMPEYGSKIPAPERWYVVNYLRTLQRAAGATPTGPAAGGAGAGATPAPAAAPAATTTGAPSR